MFATMKDLAEGVLRNPKYPPEWPYSPIDFERQDESDDSLFYSQPRLVYHIDEYAVAALTGYYARNFKDGDDVLDVCSSWVSHYPDDWRGGNVVGLGMNGLELGENGRLKSYVVRDLNEDPTLPLTNGRLRLGDARRERRLPQRAEGNVRRDREWGPRIATCT